MIHRCAAILIVLFWLTMTGLLVRNEWRPGESAFREVPPAHVLKLLLVHGQSSDLNIFSEKLHLGRLHVQPRMRKEDNARAIEFKLDLQLRLPGLDRQTISVEGEWEMDKTLAMRRFRIDTTVTKPVQFQVRIRGDAAEHRAHYTVITGSGMQEERDFPLDVEGVRSVLQQTGADPAMLDAARPSQGQIPIIKAQQSTLEIHGEKIDTYLVTIEHGGQTLLEFQVDQLGHILQGRTLIGYTLTPDDITP